MSDSQDLEMGMDREEDFFKDKGNEKLSENQIKFFKKYLDGEFYKDGKSNPISAWNMYAEDYWYSFNIPEDDLELMKKYYEVFLNFFKYMYFIDKMDSFAFHIVFNKNLVFNSSDHGGLYTHALYENSIF